MCSVEKKYNLIFHTFLYHFIIVQIGYIMWRKKYETINRI